jgi:uncharacterized protein
VASKPFLVQVATLLRRPGSRRVEHRQGLIRDLAVSGSAVPRGTEVSVDVVLESVHRGILASGDVATRWSGPCRRCLEPAGGDLAVQVRELFEEGGDCEQSYPLRGDQLDLEPLARDAIVLELPLAPLCQPGCQGLCPTCGANRNRQECGCGDSVPPDPRWAGLDALARPAEEREQ